MYQINKKETIQLFLGGTVIGFALFLVIYGYRIIDVTYDDWLYIGGDLSQHYLGWMYFRRSPWDFPLGLIKGLTGTSNISIIYMDSIPLFAIIFKLFSPVLPNTFQYFGIWGILSYGLMGGLATLLIRRFTNNKITCLISSVFFTVSPYILQRMFAHTSLGGQWIIIWGLIIWLYDLGGRFYVKKGIIWTITLCLAATIHIYFIPMIVVFIFCESINEYLKNKKLRNSIFIFLCPIVFALLFLYLLGAFIQGGELSIEGLGFFSANLNTLFNPIFGISKIYKELPHGGGQYEGMGYLGAGIILLMIISGYQLFLNRRKLKEEKKYKNIKILLTFLACSIFLILALSPTVMLGEQILFEIPWPDFITKILGIFRSSGRFIWPLSYVIVLFCIVTVISFTKDKWSFLVLGLACIIQLFDLSGYIMEKHNQFSSQVEYADMLSTNKWDIVCKDKNNLIFVPYTLPYENAEFAFALGKYAYNKTLTFNSFYVSRPNEKEIITLTEKFLREIGTADAENNVYIFPDRPSIYQKNIDLFFYDLDGVIVGLSDQIEELEENRIYSDKELLISLTDMQFSGNGIKEEQKLYICPNTIMYGPYYPIVEGEYLCTIEGKNLDFGILEIASYENSEIYPYDILQSTNEQIEVKFVIPKTINDLEIKMYNSEQTIIEITSIKLLGEK